MQSREELIEKLGQIIPELEEAVKKGDIRRVDLDGIEAFIAIYNSGANHALMFDQTRNLRDSLDYFVNNDRFYTKQHPDGRSLLNKVAAYVWRIMDKL